MALDKKRSVYEIAIEIGGKMKETLSRSVGKTKTELDGLEGSFAKMNKTANGLNKFIGGTLIVAGGAFVVNKLKDVATSAKDAASEMETYRATLNTVLRDEKRAGEMMAWATDFAAHTPFNTGDIVDAVTRLEAYGFKSQTMMENIGNMASAMNKDLPTAVEAVYKATLGEMELMENNFAITKKMIGEKSQEWYGQAAVNASGAIANAELYNNTLLRMIEEKFEGGMERQSKTWAGIESNMEDSKDAILRKIVGMDDEANALEGGAYAKYIHYMGTFAEKISDFSNSPLLGDARDGVAEMIEGFAVLATGADNLCKKLNDGKGILETTVELAGNLATALGNSATIIGKILDGDTKGAMDTIYGTVKETAEQRSPYVYQTMDKLEKKDLSGWGGFWEGLRTIFSPRQAAHPMLELKQPTTPRETVKTTVGDINVTVTTQPGDDADAIGRTVGERVREAIAEVQHQNSRTRLTRAEAK